MKRRLAGLGVVVAVAGVVLAAGALAEEGPRILDHRMAGWHRTMVATNEAVPNTVVFTYLTQQRTAVLSNVLAKFAPAIGGVGATQAEAISVEDFPGGVTARFTLDGVRVITEVTPLFVGRGTMACEGAALYHITTDPPTAVTVGIGGPGEQQMGVTPDVGRDTLVPLADLAVSGAEARFTTGREGLHAGVSARAPLAAREVEGGQALSVTFPSGGGNIVLAYGDDAARVDALLGLDRGAARAAVGRYYAALLEQHIDTPEDALDGAFRSALYNLEYNWNEPYGWNECIHHWLAMWHNQHTAGAEWIGQEDRSRLCTLTTAENLLPSGAVPQFTMDGTTRRDFGGSNHFWAWQARHYYKFTGDREFAAAVAPALDTVLAQTFAEHDPDDNLLVAWGLQIGNQEDFVQFYHDGATPSIEVINMMRTRAELAEGLGDGAVAALWHARADRAAAVFLDGLWLEDLGRPGNYVDQHGKMRPDGQYHTFLYPSLWGIVDELDGYTSLRHVHDRLTGADGEVYCSNNFPNHDNGTWGMQAGAAQQPWAAWAYSRAGQRNAAYRPLLAIASEVMNDNLRGAWPEVMLEHTPAYFTPPAGLFVASVTEAIFGLTVDVPAGEMGVAPAFPDAWPEAHIQLAKYGADYRREGDRAVYTVRSEAPLARRLRWALPPSSDIHVTANGQPLDVSLRPGVNCIFVEGLAPVATETRLDIAWTPLRYTVRHEGSVAEGDTMTVAVQGPQVRGLVDRAGVTAGAAVTDALRIELPIRRGLLDDCLPYGPLGQVTFSRRTVFLDCEQAGARFYQPIDFTVLPRVAAAPVGGLAVSETGITATLRLRNNTRSAMDGQAWLRLARHDAPFDLRLPPRAEATVPVTFPPSAAGLLSVGENNAVVSFPGGASVELRLDWRPTPEHAALLDFARARIVPIPLPEEALSPFGDWKGLREGSHGGPVPWPGWVEPLTGIEEQDVFETEALPGVRFEVTPGEWVIVGERVGKPGFRMGLPPGHYRKVFLLLATFADNHDMFTELGHVTLRGSAGVVRARTLRMPGDVDWWEPHGMADTMGTARYPRDSRFALPPLLRPEDAGWDASNPPDLPVHDGLLLGRQRKVAPSWLPPSFPQPEYWATSRVIQAPHCTFNVVELDLGKPMALTSLALDTTGICPGFGLYGVVAEVTGGMDRLSGTPWLPEGRFREPTLLFDLGGEADLAGWTLAGAALGEAVGQFSLNTLVAAGESAAGRALSPPFTLPAEAATLEVEMHGGTNHVEHGEDNLVLRLIDAATGAVLARVEPPGSHVITTVRMPVRDFAGRLVRLDLFDANTAPSYAWIGLRQAAILAGD